MQLSGHLLTLRHIFRAVLPVRQQPVRKLLGHVAVHCLHNRNHQLTGVTAYMPQFYNSNTMTHAQRMPELCYVLPDLHMIL